MKKLTKKLINYVAQAAQLAPPAVPRPEAPPLAPPAKPSQTTPTIEPPNPPLNLPPVPPATPIQIWPNPNVPIIDCENKPLPTSWPFPTPPIKGLTSDTDAEWQKKVCSGITKHYTEMRRRLDTCFGNCSSGGEEYNFEQCLRLFYDDLVGRAAVMPYEYQNEMSQFAAPPEREPQLSPTQRRNCEKYKTRCHCSFERKRWERKLEAAKLAEFYAAGCKPFVIRTPNNEVEEDRFDQERKKRFKEECDRVKKIFPFGSKCAKDGQGKYVYTDCKDACEKCGIQ